VLDRIILATLSRLLPLIIAVGKYSATFLTAARICRAYQIRIRVGRIEIRQQKGEEYHTYIV